MKIKFTTKEFYQGLVSPVGTVASIANGLYFKDIEIGLQCSDQESTV